MSTAISSLYRALPSMDAVLAALAGQADPAPRALLKKAAEEFLDRCRREIQEGVLTDPAALSLEALLPALAEYAHSVARPHFRRVLNATGVVIHTNLGRSPLAIEAADAARQAALYYGNLEFDLESGKRGSRYDHVEALIRALTGAEAALVVNNNAAAALIVLDTLCKGREVVVSRGQLVEIGGSFRIPEVMERSGCLLREVGATNRVHARDYEQAINDGTAALLRVHTSNFHISGFTSEVSREDMAAIAHAHGLPLLDDLGSGCLCDFAALSSARASTQSAGTTESGNPKACATALTVLSGEQTVAKAVAGGADVVFFSGDKMLGGPQAGIIAGRAEYIARIKKNPLNRALRIDKMTLAALEATLRLYLDPEEAKKRIPILRMLLMTESELRDKARKLARQIRARIARQSALPVLVSVEPGLSTVGGGSAPGSGLPTHLVRVRVTGGDKDTPGPDLLRERLLRADPPLALRVERDALCLDPRTLDEGELALAARAVARALDQALSTGSK